MIELTLQDVLNMTPCTDYKQDRLEGLFDDRETLGLDDLLALGLPPEDLLWVLLRKPWLNEEQLLELAGVFFRDIFWLREYPSEKVKDAIILAHKASVGQVGPEHIRTPENPDTNIYYCESTKGMLAASYTALWAAVAIARASGGEDANIQRHLQVERTVEKIRELGHG